MQANNHLQSKSVEEFQQLIATEQMCHPVLPNKKITVLPSQGKTMEAAIQPVHAAKEDERARATRSGNKRQA